MTNLALTLTRYGGSDALSFAEIAMPVAAPGVAVVRVHAAGVNGLDWKIREGFLKDAMPTVFPAVLGIELAGVVEAVAPGSRFRPGDRVFGLAARGNGAYARFVAVPEALLAPTPDGLDDVTAAALPVAGLTATQMLAAGGALEPGATVLVHGASGGVGTVLVQLAKRRGLRVIATGSPASRAHLTQLGVDRIIDRTAERFEDVAGPVDLVIDLVGGDAPDRSWALLPSGGTLVTAVRFDVAAPRRDGRHGVGIRMQPDAARLAELGAAAAEGQLRLTLAETVPFSRLSDALERNRLGHAPGKIVVEVGAAT